MRDRKALLDYCLAKSGAVETFPFGPEVHVIKVISKMFALISADDPLRISLKCDPTWAQLLRDTYPAVQPNRYFKRHWNTVHLDGSVPDDEIREMIDHSYNLVVKSLKKAERDTL